MELRDALTQIAEIRQQMARGQIFRGYRAATTAFSGVAAIVTALAQQAFFPAATRSQFVLLWSAAAAICLIAVGIEMAIRTRRSASQVQKQLTLLAVEQFFPSLLAGGLLTWFFCAYLREESWMLPGLWMILFSLGIFASARLLPRAVFAVAGFYLLAGILTLLITQDQHSVWRFSPWTMAAAFGLGQFATAAILYIRLEAPHREDN
jgi:hypothetical protein